MSQAGRGRGWLPGQPATTSSLEVPLSLGLQSYTARASTHAASTFFQESKANVDPIPPPSPLVPRAKHNPALADSLAGSGAEHPERQLNQAQAQSILALSGPTAEHT